MARPSRPHDSSGTCGGGPSFSEHQKASVSVFGNALNLARLTTMKAVENSFKVA